MKFVTLILGIATFTCLGIHNQGVLADDFPEVGDYRWEIHPTSGYRTKWELISIVDVTTRPPMSITMKDSSNGNATI